MLVRYWCACCMATTEDLKTVLKETLESRGVLGQLKARVRAEVFNALTDEGEPKPQLSHENLLINELIREYLQFNRYSCTCSVLVAESGQPQEPLERGFLAQELNITQDEASRSVPLLYGIVHHLTQSKASPRQPSDLRSEGLGGEGKHNQPQPGRVRSKQQSGMEAHDATQPPEPVVVQGGKQE